MCSNPAPHYRATQRCLKDPPRATRAVAARNRTALPLTGPVLTQPRQQFARGFAHIGCRAVIHLHHSLLLFEEHAGRRVGKPRRYALAGRCDGLSGTYCAEALSGAMLYMEAARTNNSTELEPGEFFYKPSLTDVNLAAFNTLYANGAIFTPTWDS